MAEQLPASRQKQRAIPSQAQDRIRQRLARSKLEQTFQVLKVRFNHRKIRYRGLEKYTVQLFLEGLNRVGKSKIRPAG
ncbi:hypothetical protein METHPM2_720008 [Pseudomonas sp. PM2]